MAQDPYIPPGAGGLSVPTAGRSDLLQFPRLATYSQIVAKLQWEPAAIDFAADVRAWPSLPEERRRRLTTLLAGFCVAEDAVAEHLTPFADRAEHVDTMMMWIFFLQRRDEDRHAQFFDRVAAEVLRLPGETPAERRAAARDLVPPALLELFEVRLPGIAADLAAGRADIVDGVGLYHMVLEGAVFTAGQRALLDDLKDGVLPGVREGVVTPISTSAGTWASACAASPRPASPTSGSRRSWPAPPRRRRRGGTRCPQPPASTRSRCAGDGWRSPVW